MAKIKLKPAKDNPLTRRVLMGILSIFFVITMLLTLPRVVGYIAPVIGVDPNKMLWWGKTLSSIAGGVIFVVVAGALAGAPIIAGALVVAGLISIGWGIYRMAQKEKMDMGSMGKG